jgi:hypothetical protein
VLIVRYLFGFTGTQLTDGAVGNGATRTESASIIAFLNTFTPAVTPATNTASAQQSKRPATSSSGRQQVTSRVEHTSKRGVKTFDVSVDYSATGLSHTGLGLRMHFDSSKLSLKELSNIFSAGALSHQVQDDTLDFDGDPRTDRFINIAWMDPWGGWPGTAKAPLFTATFSEVKGNGSKSTTIRYSVSDMAAGADVVFEPVQIKPSQRGKHR